MRNLDDIIGSLPAERRAEIERRGAALVSQEKALRQLRRARSFTQVSIAKALDIEQASVSRLEKRSDMLISTMRSYVEAMGGSLRLVAEFPDGAVEIAGLAEISGAPDTKRPAKSKRRPIAANDPCPA